MSRKRSALYHRVMLLSNRYARSLKRPVGPCMDCGTDQFIVHDHRDYSEPLKTDAVCVKCNARRGAGLVVVLDPDTLRGVVVS